MQVLSTAWLVTLLVTIVSATALCLASRRWPGRPSVMIDVGLALVLIVTTGLFLFSALHGQRFSVASSLPLPLCDLATIVAAAALLTRSRPLVELTYFWGLAGTLQAILTPDLGSAFPSLEFFEYVIAHVGIVCAALVLVVGQRIRPARFGVVRVFAITLGYTALVGLADWLSGGDYMYLRSRPSSVTLLNVLGPWPWYIASAAGVAIVLLVVLDLPFMRARRRALRLSDLRRDVPSSPAAALGAPGAAGE